MMASIFRNLLVFVVVVHHVSIVTVIVAEQYYEVPLQVLETIHEFMNPGVFALDVFYELYKMKAFPNRLDAPDRDRAMQNMYSVIRANNHTNTAVRIYYGLENGLFLGYTGSPLNAVPMLSYREPGNSGFDPVVDTSMQKYWDICVHPETGAKETCQLEEGAKYVSCRGGGNTNCNLLVPCPDPDSQRNCTAADGSEESRLECEKNIKWCHDYSIQTVGSGGGSRRKGYVPRSYSCINQDGSFTRIPGEALLEVFHETTNSVTVELGDCTFESGARVTQKISGPYAYCAGDTTCTTYTGVYRTEDYDPRYRPWYINVKNTQRSRWSEPYTFFSKEDLGMTYANPLFSTDSRGRTVFAGVLATDYLLSDISHFLVRTYSNDDIDTIVGIYEHVEPHNVIALSTGSSTSKRVSSKDPNQPCVLKKEETNNIFDGTKCVAIRIPVTELGGTGNERDLYIQNAHLAFTHEGYDYGSGDVLSVKADPEHTIQSDAYAASSFLYELPHSNLKWRIVVLRKMERDTLNSIIKGEPLFTVVCGISAAGFLLCMTLFIVFYKNRKHRAVKFSDINLTSLFILNCALLNLSILPLLGENTNELCLFRIWSLYILLATALSPLFIKAYRTWLLLHRKSKKKRHMNNWVAWLWTWPIPLLQSYILLVFTFTDPPQSTENISLDQTEPLQQIQCRHKTSAFIITEGVFHLILVTIGCLLAYKTRNLSSKISDAKALLFALYNIVFTMLMIGSIVAVVTLSEQGELVMKAIGIFWATVFSSSAFVIPRLMQANKEKKDRSSRFTKARHSLLNSKRIPLRRSDGSVDGDDYYEDDEWDSSLKILVCTANMGNAKPTPSSMAAWIPKGGRCDNVTPLPGKSIRSEIFDLIVIGMQESTFNSKDDTSVDGLSEVLDNSNGSRKPRKSIFANLQSLPTRILEDDDDDDAEMNYLAAVEGQDTVTLRKLIKNTLGKSFTAVEETARGGMRQYVFAANEIAPFLDDIRVTGANTGVGGVLANKGGICISLEYMKTRFSFISAHLAAHEGQSYYQARCDNIHEILKSASSRRTYYDSSVSSHHMFVLGDLNFRTKFGDEAKHEDNVRRAMKLIEEEDFDTLYSFDELQKGLANGDLLLDFQTLPCNFKPTFKVQREPDFVYKKQRTPSYTDRILFRSAGSLETKFEPLAYEPCVNFITSDHKPIRGAFAIVPNEIIKPVCVPGTLHLKFHQMAGCDLMAGDIDGFSDPYLMIVWDGVNLKQGGRHGLGHVLPGAFSKIRWPRTRHRFKTLNPEWKNDEISLFLDEKKVEAEAILFIVVMDYDFGKSDNRLGTLPLNLKELLSMVNFQNKKQLSFDKPLQRNGKFAGRVKFKLDISIKSSVFHLGLMK